jgi:hypothetical protein
VAHLKSAAPGSRTGPDARHALAWRSAQWVIGTWACRRLKRRARHPATGAIVRASSLTVGTRDGTAPVASFMKKATGDAFMYSALLAALANVASFQPSSFLPT